MEFLYGLLLWPIGWLIFARCPRTRWWNNRPKHERDGFGNCYVFLCDRDSRGLSWVFVPLVLTLTGIIMFFQWIWVPDHIEDDGPKSSGGYR